MSIHATSDRAAYPQSPSSGALSLSARPEYYPNPLPLQPPPPTRAEERRLVLAELDNAPFTRFHVRIALTTAAGFFTDAYDVFSINLTGVMIGFVYLGDPEFLKNTRYLLLLKIATPIGNLVGQVAFGLLADVFGRRKMYGAELIVMSTAAFGQALSGHGPAISVFASLFIWRVIMGIGIGGDYPTSAIIGSEFSAVRFRGRMVTAIIAMQGLGIIVAGIVALIATASFKSAILRAEKGGWDPKVEVDDLWRIVIGLGIIPNAITLWSRLTIPESPRYTMDVDRNLEQASSDADFVKEGKFDTVEDRPLRRLDHLPRASIRDFINYYSRWPHLRVLLACSWSWFVTDFVFYGLTLNPAVFLQAIRYGESSSLDVWETLYNSAVGNTVLACAGLVPGYWLTYFFVDSWGRKTIQYMGFAALSILFFIMGGAFRHLSNPAFAALYSISNLFLNFGPNSTTFVIPAELFPTRYRATSHGIAGSAGKLGAIVALVILIDRPHTEIGRSSHVYDPMLLSMACLMLTGLVSTYFLPETMGISLERSSGEEEGDDAFSPVEPSDTNDIPLKLFSFVGTLWKRRSSKDIQRLDE